MVALDVVVAFDGEDYQGFLPCKAFHALQYTSLKYFEKYGMMIVFALYWEFCLLPRWWSRENDGLLRGTRNLWQGMGRGWGIAQ